MSEDTFTMITETFKSDKTNEDVEGITIIIDGTIKNLFDAVISKSDNYCDYTELVRDAIFFGVNDIIESESKG